VFLDVARNWLCLDLDDLAYAIPTAHLNNIQEAANHLGHGHPDDMTDEQDPRLAARQLLDQIAPDELRRVESVVQLSASTGLKEKGAGMKCGIHWWLLLDRPWTCAELYAWDEAYEIIQKSGSCFEVDGSLFNPVQVHYTAGPDLPAGVEPISRLVDICLPDHAAIGVGLPERPVAARGTLPDAPWEQRLDEINGQKTQRMTDARRDEYIERILEGKRFYKNLMPLIKRALWQKTEHPEIVESMRGLLLAAPPSAKRDEYINNLEREVARLSQQVERTRRRMAR